MQRAREIPENFLEYYKELIETNGKLTLDDLGAVAISLTDDQITGGLMFDPELGFVFTAVTADRGRRDVLRAYGLMDANQKSWFATEEGLPFANITDEQWIYLEEIIADRLGGVHIIDGSIRLVQREEEEQRPDTEIIELLVYTAYDEEPKSVRTWVNLPNQATIDRLKEQRAQIEEAREKAKESENNQQSKTETETDN